MLGVVETAEPDSAYLEPAHSLLLDLLVLNIMFLECEDIKSAQAIARFLNAAVLYIRRLGELGEALLEVLAKIQDVCISKIQYPDWCTMEDGQLGEDEENYKVLRSELSNLYTNTISVAQLKDRSLKILQSKLTELEVSKASHSEVELPLYMLSQLDLSLPEYQPIIGDFSKIDFSVSK